jgi:ankyrin repeat protein
MVAVILAFFLLANLIGSAINISANYDKLNPIEILIGAVADLVHSTLPSKLSPIDKAVSRNDFPKVEKLLKHTPNLVFNKSEELHYDDGEAVELAGGTPLHFAAAYGHKNMVEFLLFKHAAVDIKDNDGETPLLVAVMGGYKDVAQLLLAHHAEINAANTDGETTLHWAAWNGDLEMTKLLLANHADVNAKQKDGVTPLDAAVGFHCKSVAELLLAHGAEVNAKSKNGGTPLQIAENMKYKDIIELLHQYGGHE